MAELTKENVESMQVHNETWVGQIRDAMNVNGGDIENATTQDYVLVRLSFFFRPKKTSTQWKALIVDIICSLLVSKAHKRINGSMNPF